MSSIQDLLRRFSFVSQLDHWRTRQHDDVLRDIYDGQIWKDFMYVQGIPFLAHSYTLALGINIDWFQPYKLTESSVGAVYITILNLPYHLRYKREFVILAGIIPGPNEPKRDVNSFLRPLVGELLDLWQGIPMHVHGEDHARNIRCALICVACDMPASRKTCGLLGHSARLGCSRCKKEFSGQIGSKDYSGFDRDSWVARSNHDHRSSIDVINKSRNKTERDRLESQHGCRYSVLLDLPYFDPIRMTIVDPMHNLLLGTARHVMKDIWIKQDIITKSNLKAMQEKMDRMKTPLDVGRIPRKVESGFSGFTADQFKNWVNLYSIPCLSGILSSEHLENWCHFVLSCRILCQHSLTLDQIVLADCLLLHFCKRTERLYGKSAITPNMHMHGHLREIFMDYGPVYSFWCFSYERYNGILGNQPSNNKDIESQLMRRFLMDNLAFSLTSPTNFREEFDVVSLPTPTLAGSILQTINPVIDESLGVEVPQQYTRTFLDCTEKERVTEILAKLQACQISAITVNTLVNCYRCLKVNGDQLSARKRHSSIVMLKWDTELFGELPSPLPTSLTILSSIIRPANIIHFLKVAYSVHSDSSVTMDSSESHTVLLARVSWYLPHPAFSSFGKPAQLWCNDLFEVSGVHSFVPLHLYQSRCIHCTMSHCDENVLVIVPLVN